MKQQTFLIIGLVLIGFLLRLPSLQLGLWQDEASTYFDALPNDFETIINTVIYSELNPPGFYLIMHQWMQWFGSQEIIFKLPALFFGLLLIPSTYALGRLTGSREAGLIAATVATFTQDAVYYSQEARPYTLAALLCCWVIFLYCKAIATTKYQTWYLVTFVICADILLYVQYTGLLLIGSLIIITLLLLCNRTVNIKIMPFAIAFGTIFLLFMPWLPIFLTHLYTGTPWTSKDSFLKALFGNISYTILEPRKAVFLCILLGLGVKLKDFLAQIKETNYKHGIFPEIHTFILGTCFILLAVMQAILSYGGRYMLPFTPIAWAFYGSCFFALFQCLSDFINSRWTGQWYRFSRQVILVVIIVLLVFANKYDFYFGNINKSGIRALANDWELTKTQDKTMYILSPDFLGPTFGYYFAKHPVPFYGFARWDKPEIFSPIDYAEIWSNPTLIEDTEQRIQQEIQKGYTQLALIQVSEPMGDAGKVKYSQINQFLARLKQKYSLLKKTDYPGQLQSVSLYLFDLINIAK